MISKYLNKIGLNSKIASKKLNQVNLRRRNKVLETYIKNLSKNKKKIIKENLKDIYACKREDLKDRLKIDGNTIEKIR